MLGKGSEEREEPNRKGRKGDARIARGTRTTLRRNLANPLIL